MRAVATILGLLLAACSTPQTRLNAASPGYVEMCGRMGYQPEQDTRICDVRAKPIHRGSAICRAKAGRGERIRCCADR